MVGGLLTVGTVVLMVGASVSDAVFAGMRSATINSMTGDLQVYDQDAKDELSVFGQPGGLQPDVGQIDNFGVVRDALMQLENVRAVVPLGRGNSIIFGSNTLDMKLAELRNAVMEGNTAAFGPLKGHIRQMVKTLREDLKNLDGIVDAASVDADALALADQVATDAWWSDFDAKSLSKLEILDNKVAPLAAQGQLIFFSYIGTDPQAFAKAFKLFKIVDGEMIPPGRRGVVLSKRRYERDMKNRIAYKLDEIRDALKDGRLLADDEELTTWISRNVRQRRNLLYDMTPVDIEALHKALGAFMKSEDATLDDLLKSFLDMDDTNFATRYEWFYANIAPKIVLYRYNIGDYITVTGRGRTGFAKSVNLKIYGTFTFESLEKSQLAGFFHIIDLLSFRDLYGTPTASEREEMAVIAEEMKVEDLGEDEAINELFGENSQIAETGDSETASAGFDEFAGASIAGRRKEALAAMDLPFSQKELDYGLTVNASVLLKNPDLLEESLQAIRTLNTEKGLRIQPSPWAEASGIIGGFTQAIQIALLVVIFIIFVVVLIIINNSIVMATMDRTQEIGTIRAIGGQRGLITRLFIGEAMVLGALSAGLGVAIGAAIISWMNTSGIPATDPILYFLFGGPRLHPELTLFHPLVAVGTVLSVTFIATLYPAWLAARIEPVTAMRGKD